MKRLAHLHTSLTTGIEKGSRVILPWQRTIGTVAAVEVFRDGTQRAFFVRVAGDDKLLRIEKGDAMKAPTGALFLSPGCDDLPPTTPFFYAKGGVA
jgi:hypothetical protein